MKWSKYFLPILLITGFISCNANNNSDSPPEKFNDTVATESIDSLKFESSSVDSLRQQLKRYLSDPLDFPRIKNNFHMLEMGHILPEKYVPKIDSGYYNYNYGAIANLLRHAESRNDFFPPLDSLMNAGGLVSFSTYKPWSTAKEKQMSTDNEIIIGYESKVSHPAFGDYDFVRLRKQEILNRFGNADSERNNCLIYFDSNSVLVLHHRNKKIDWFKFYRLNESVQTVKDLPNTLFHWNLRQNH